MGAVYRAHDLRLGRPVAIKCGEERSATTRERLLREARAAAALKHPHIVAIYDAGRGGRRPFMVMELIEGSSLRDIGPALAGRDACSSRARCARRWRMRTRRASCTAT